MKKTKPERTNYRKLYEEAQHTIRSLRAQKGNATKIKNGTLVRYVKEDGRTSHMFVNLDIPVNGTEPETDRLQRLIDSQKELIAELEKRNQQLKKELQILEEDSEMQANILSDYQTKNKSLSAASDHLIASLHHINTAHNV